MEQKEKIERGHRFEDGKLVLIRKQIGQNGAGKQVVVISEEYDVTEKEVKEVLEKHHPERLAKTLEQLDNIKKQLDNLKDETNKFENTREFKQFKKFLEENKFRFDQVKMIQDRDRAAKQVEHLENEARELEDWRYQMSSIKFNN